MRSAGRFPSSKKAWLVTLLATTLAFAATFNVYSYVDLAGFLLSTTRRQAVSQLTQTKVEPVERHEGCLKVITGIVTKSTELERQQNWKILLRMHPKPEANELDCGLNFVFVSYYSQGQSDDHSNKNTTRRDELLVHLSSSVEWFQYSLNTYPDAHYIALMKSDTAIFRRQVENEFLFAKDADYFGKGFDSNDSAEGSFHVSPGFFAVSARLAKRIVAMNSIVDMSGDEDAILGALIEKAGLSKKCCGKNHVSGHHSSQKCEFTCHQLLVGDDQDQHLINHNATLMELLALDYTPQVSFKPNQGDMAAKQFIQPMPRVVWAIWFGPPMTGARLRAYERLRDNIGAPLQLITATNLHKFNTTFQPMHPLIGKRGLSAVHYTDYLRTYFMFQFGGGYHDVKPHSRTWAPSLNSIEADPDVWLLGIKEYGGMGCDESYVVACGENRNMTNLHSLKGQRGGPCCEQVYAQKSKVTSNGAYIMRPGTLLGALWNELVESHMTAKFEKVLAHPARAPRGGQDSEYPICWTELHGDAFHPVQTMYTDHIRFGLPPWDGGAYSDPSENEPRQGENFTVFII